MGLHAYKAKTVGKDDANGLQPGGRCGNGDHELRPIPCMGKPSAPNEQIAWPVLLSCRTTPCDSSGGAAFRKWLSRRTSSASQKAAVFQKFVKDMQTVMLKLQKTRSSILPIPSEVDNAVNRLGIQPERRPNGRQQKVPD